MKLAATRPPIAGKAGISSNADERAFHSGAAVNDNVVFLKFKNPEDTKEDYITFIACKACSNKTYTLTEDNSSPYPLIKCAACGQHCGRMGWIGQDGSK